MTPTISTEAPAEMFKDLVEEALDRQGVETSEDSTVYLVHLLDSFVRPDGKYAAVGARPGQPLAEIFLSAVRSDGSRRITGLRFTGDLALFLVGFFSESLRRGAVGVDYYSRLGGSAYGTLSQLSGSSGAAELFEELATNFVRLADVICEVSETCSLTDHRDLLRLYERWHRTGSQHSAERLRDRGIHVVPVTDSVN